MKKIFTLSLLALMSVQFLSAQEVGFFPPEGSTFSADSSIVNLPNAFIGQNYNETISFYSTETLVIEGIDFELEFVSATITSFSSPLGMDYNCNIADCAFIPNVEGEVSLSGIPSEVGEYTLDIIADIVISIDILGEVAFTVPYTTGDNALLDLALAGDNSALNSFIPTFILNVESNVGVEELANLSDVVVYPNPATTDVTFELTSVNENTNVQIFDLLGNLVYKSTYSKDILMVNTSNFTNGVYIYKLSSDKNSVVGRLVINK
tara:strand:+ start:1949 stop:2740 length:792 start_codon:yes stop_codon:yes gene_type:complete